MNLRQYLDLQQERGAAAALADKLGISLVYLWQIAARQGNRVPSPGLCIRFEQATDGEVTRRDLRPKDWRLIWPEMAAAEDAARLPKRRARPQPAQA